MPVIRIGKKVLKTIWICLGIVLALLVAFHFWFVYHAEEILQDLVASRSNGKLKLEVEKFRFNWFGNRMELRNAVFFNTDTASAGTSYRFAVKRIRIKAKGIWPFIFENKALINELHLLDPDITVIRLRPSADSLRDDNASVTNEMGRIYNSIQDALQVLQVKTFNLENASFTLQNRMKPEQAPVVINYIDLGINNLKVDTSKLTGREKLFFSDNVFARSRNQNILFPDGRHRLSFRNFRINIEKKIVEFDSCSIAALKTETQPTGFSIFFDRLQMTNIDFDTLYHAEMIKADSVYCVNPHFTFEADLDQRKKSNMTARPRLDEIIRKLTGDLQLNFVVMRNAGFDINTIRNGQPSSFTSHNNNFEMQGLRIDNDARQPLRVERFAMAIRNYENFLKDSLYSLQFDSIHVNNDRIYLNNFSFQHLDNGRPVNSFSVPRFQLTGLSWDDLLFERRLTAQQATLFNPDIHYAEPPQKDKKETKRNVFDLLANMNEVLRLEDLYVVDGSIKLKLNGGLAMELQRATISVESRDLLKSSQLSGIRRSVNYLDFEKGIFRINDVTVKLDSTSYSGVNSRFNASAVTITDDAGTLNAKARQVGMNEIFINESTGDISIGGLSWQQADVKVSGFKTSGPSATAAFISLTDIDGKNTRFSSSSGDRSITAFLETFKAKAFLLKPGEIPFLAETALSANNIHVKDKSATLHVDAAGINEGQYSWVNNISYKKHLAGDTTNVFVPKLSFIPHVQSLIEGTIKADDIRVHRPVVSIVSSGYEATKNETGLIFPAGRMDKILVQEPVIHYTQRRPGAFSRWEWDGGYSSNNSLVLVDVVSDSASFAARQFYLSLDNFSLENARGRRFSTGKGEITALLQDFSFQQHSKTEPSWQGTVATLDGKNLEADSIGKNDGSLLIQTVALKDFTVNAATIKNIPELVRHNKQFRLQQFSGQYSTATDRIQWFNAVYDKKDHRLLLDSFHYSPVLNKTDYFQSKKYQSDYVQVKTGAITAGPFDLDKFIIDSVVSAGVLKVEDIVFSDHRDNRLPFKEGLVKPLLTERIRSVPFKTDIDSVILSNAHVAYTETNPQGQEATVVVADLDLTFFSVRNHGLKKNDSLVIMASGRLMDAARVQIKAKESYADSLSGFLMTVRIDGTDIRILNPVLEPLASVRLRSGRLDSLQLRVNGDDQMAWGEIRMSYHDLKIQLLKKPGSDKPAGKLLNFLLNTFVIKTNNKGKTGDVFFVRNRDRSSMNYLIKIVLSGVNSSVGVKGTKKNLRSWKKQVQQRNLPPFDYD